MANVCHGENKSSYPSSLKRRSTFEKVSSEEMNTMDEISLNIKKEVCDWESVPLQQGGPNINEHNDWELRNIKEEPTFDIIDREKTITANSVKEEDIKSESVSQHVFPDKEATGLGFTPSSPPALQNDETASYSSSPEKDTALSRKRRYPPSKALALLQEMNGYDSDGGEEAIFVIEEDGDDETDAEVHSDEDEGTTSEKKSRRPCRKKRLVTRKNKAAARGIKAKDGTVWIQQEVGCLPAGESTTHMSFNGTAGPTEHAKCKVTSRLQSFLCLIDVNMLLTIRDCTVHEGRRTDPSWSLSLYELMAFISILFTRAATTTFGAVVDAWSELFVIPAIKDTMPRDRYQTIMGHLRFDNKDTRAERVKNDRFAAISDIWQRFVQNCISSYNPGQHITVDEQLFPTKVRCPFLQYITNKPDKFGIRFCIAADLETKYMCNATPYLGKDPSHPTGERLSEDVVMNLMEPFLDKGRTVTTGNFFTSLSLANRLLQRNTTLLGAINKVHRELPPPAKDTSGLEEFSTLVFRTDSTLLTVYVPKKKKSVCILSTMHQNVEIGDDRKKNPNTVIDYNNMKCAVDIMDQKVRAYSVRAGTRRWPVAVFYNMLDLAVMNAHILYKACTGSTEKRRVFLARLAEELRCYYLQEKALEKVKKVQLKLQAPRPPSPPGKKTQCQVLLRCHRNRSTNRCVQCNRYTCRKCRKEDPWVCGNC